MKINQVKEILNQVFEEDEALKYALATNIAKYGRPQSKPSDKPAKLTKGLEKKREKAVKDLKKSMDEGMNDEKAVQAIAAAVADYANISNDKFLQGIIRTALGSGYMEERVVSDNESPSLKAKIAAEDFMRGYRTTLRRVEGNFGREAAEEFKTIVKSKMAQVQEGLNERLGVSKDKLSNIVKFVGAVNFSQMIISLRDENVQDEIISAFEDQYPAVMDKRDDLQEDEGTLNKIADMLDRKFPDLRFDVNTMADRIDVRGSQQDLANFGRELHGEKIFDYEVFAIDDDDRGEIVRIVKSDSIMRNEEYKVAGRTVKLNKGKNPDGTDWTVTFPNGKTTSLADVLALIDPKPGLTKEDKKKADRCLRIARRKIPQSSAYRSGLIVKCRKGMIWKKEK